MGTLVLVRHSITAASAAGRNLGQRSDPPLAAEGLELAGRLAATLALELTELPHDEVRLLSSPALRCRQTAEILATAVAAGGVADGSEMEIHPGLIEIDYGAWDGLTADECRARDPERPSGLGGGPVHHPLPGG